MFFLTVFLCFANEYWYYVSQALLHGGGLYLGALLTSKGPPDSDKTLVLSPLNHGLGLIGKRLLFRARRLIWLRRGVHAHPSFHSLHAQIRILCVFLDLDFGGSSRFPMFALVEVCRGDTVMPQSVSANQRAIIRKR